MIIYRPGFEAAVYIYKALGTYVYNFVWLILHTQKRELSFIEKSAWWYTKSLYMFPGGKAKNEAHPFWKELQDLAAQRKIEC